MHCLNVWLTVKEAGDIDTVKNLLAEAGRLSRSEPGCLRYEVYHSQTDRNRFLLAERWESIPAWEQHRTAKAYTEIYQPQVLPLVNREAHVLSLVE
jgi:quinol monooxygenase YgiN